jgi:hypothetical protein
VIQNGRTTRIGKVDQPTKIANAARRRGRTGLFSGKSFGVKADGLSLRPENPTNARDAYKIMAVTQLKRKAKRNQAIANNRTAAIKQLTRKPEVKKVDVEAIKASFAQK